MCLNCKQIHLDDMSKFCPRCERKMYRCKYCDDMYPNDSLHDCKATIGKRGGSSYGMKKIYCGVAGCDNVIAPGSSFCLMHGHRDIATKIMDKLSEPKEKKFNSPAHYHDGKKLDAIGMMHQNFTREELEGFFKGNALKYIIRYQTKNKIEDLIKAKDYIDRIIDLYEKEKESL